MPLTWKGLIKNRYAKTPTVERNKRNNSRKSNPKGIVTKILTHFGHFVQNHITTIPTRPTIGHINPNKRSIIVITVLIVGEIPFVEEFCILFNSALLLDLKKVYQISCLSTYFLTVVFTLQNLYIVNGLNNFRNCFF